ncbi:hypothetical protein QC282_30790, partial [Streptomyces sp. DH24]|nr:hypothetical protein [Streptomyces sp. DH24]
VRPFAHSVGGSATTLAYGVTGHAAPFTEGVAGQAGGAAGQAVPFAQDLTGTVRDAAGPLTRNAVTGAEGVAESVTPGYAHYAQGYAENLQGYAQDAQGHTTDLRYGSYGI